jgi:hypothetical protein
MWLTVDNSCADGDAVAPNSVATQRFIYDKRAIRRSSIRPTISSCPPFSHFVKIQTRGPRKQIATARRLTSHITRTRPALHAWPRVLRRADLLRLEAGTLGKPRRTKSLDPRALRQKVIAKLIGCNSRSLPSSSGPLSAGAYRYVVQTLFPKHFLHVAHFVLHLASDFLGCASIP